MCLYSSQKPTQITLSHLLEIRPDIRYFTSETAEALGKDKCWYIRAIHIKLINEKLRLV